MNTPINTEFNKVFPIIYKVDKVNHYFFRTTPFSDLIISLDSDGLPIKRLYDSGGFNTNGYELSYIYVLLYNDMSPENIALLTLKYGVNQFCGSVKLDTIYMDDEAFEPLFRDITK